MWAVFHPFPSKINLLSSQRERQSITKPPKDVNKRLCLCSVLSLLLLYNIPYVVLYPSPNAPRMWAQLSI